MKRFVSSMAVFVAAIAMVSCKGDPQGTLGRGDVNRLVASPGQVFVAEGATVRVVLEVKDNFNQSNVLTGAAISAIGNGITVVRDTTFNRVFDASGNLVEQPNPTRLRYEVTGTAPVGTSFTLAANGLTLDIPVFVTPGAIPAGGVSNTAPALGEDITITLHGQLQLQDTVLADATLWDSLVSFAGAPAPIIKSVTSNSITLEAGPNTAAPAMINWVVMPYSPQVAPFTLATADTVTSPAVAQVPVTFSNNTPAGGELVTVTLGTGFTFAPNAQIFSGANCPGTAPACDAGITVSVAPDGKSLTGVFPLGSSGTTSVSGVFADAAPAFVLALPTDQTVTVGSSPFTNTDDDQNAPVISLPGSGGTLDLFDGGPFGPGSGVFAAGDSRFYRFTLTQQTDFTLQLTWNGNVAADLGAYTIDGPFTALQACTADDNGSQSGGPEGPNACSLPAGDYILAIVSFDVPSMNLYRVQIVVQ